MKYLIMSLITSAILLSCGKPVPRGATAPKNPLDSLEVQQASLETERSYSEQAGLFTFFMLPEWGKNHLNKTRDLVSLAAKYSTELDDAFVKNHTLLQKEKTLEEEQETLETSIETFFDKNYGCYEREITEFDTKCFPNPPGEWIFPDPNWDEGCDDLAFAPYELSDDTVAECKKKLKLVEDQKAKQLPIVKDKLQKLSEEKKKLGFAKLLYSSAEAVRNAVEGIKEGEDLAEHLLQYWVITDLNQSFIHPPKSSQELPKIQLALKFNNLFHPSFNQNFNRTLVYKSWKEESNNKEPGKSTDDGDNSTEEEITPDITHVEFFLERGTPVLNFILWEKRALPDGKEEKTGDFYKVNLKQYNLTFGLQYAGEFTKFNMFGRELRKGMMKMVIGPKEN